MLAAILFCCVSYCAAHGDAVSERRARVGGLWTNDNEWSAPEGSLKQAVNLSLDRDGLAAPRPGFKKNASSNASYVASRLFPWQGAILRVNAATASWLSAPATAITKTGATDLGWTAYRQRAVEARSNLYLNTDDGVRKLTGTSDVIAELAGVDSQPTLVYVTNAVGSFLANGSYCAYRFVLVHTDANNVITRSIATGSYIVKNATGGAISTIGDYTVPASAVAGDTVEMYRTRTSTVVPGNEFYLDQSIELAASAITNGYQAFADDRLDADLGAALYTNDSREGIEGSSFRPPMAKDIALFNGSMFYADTLGPQQITLKWDEGGDKSGSATGIGKRTINGTRTNASADIVMANVTGIKVGMALSDAAGWSTSPALIRVTAIVGVTVTVNATRTGGTDGAPTALTYWDTIRVGSQYFPVDSAVNFIWWMNSGVTLGLAYASATFHAYATGVYGSTFLGSGIQNVSQVQVVISERARGTSAASVFATHGSEYYPPLPEPSASSADTTLADDKANMLAWSKKDEPEHVPLTNYEPVGKESVAILRLAPTRDAMWIFKTEGLWRLTGVSSPRWRIDQFDPKLRLVAADALCTLDEIVYAWTDRGVVAVSERGIVPLSGAIDDQLRPLQRYFASTTKYGVFMAADPVSSNVILAVPSISAGVEYAASLFVFNTRTQRWSTWTASGALSDVLHMAYEPESAALFVAKNGSDIAQQRTTRDATVLAAGPVIGADYEYAVTVSAVTTTAITIAGASGWTPAVGDVLRQSTALYVVTAITDATHFTVHASGITAAAGTAYTAFTSTVQWLPFGPASMRKRWHEMDVAFDNCAGILDYAYGFSTDVSTAEATGSKRIPQGYVTPTTSAEQASSTRILIPRDAARSALLTPRVSVTQAASQWRLSEILVTSEAIDTRVSR